jgi:hypothetical protein
VSDQKDKDPFDAHLKIAEFYRKVRDERRQHEWRLTLGLWLTLAAGIVAVKDLPHIPMRVVLGFLGLVLLFHLGWVWDNFWLRNRDTDRAYKHLRKAEEFSGLVLADEPPEYIPLWTRIKDLIKDPTWTKLEELKNRVPLWEFLGTALLCITFYIVYWYHVHPLSQPSL